MKFLKNFFRKKYLVTLHMKSGASIVYRAYKFNTESKGNDLVSIEQEAVNFGPLYTRLDDISIITYKRSFY